MVHDLPFDELSTFRFEPEQRLWCLRCERSFFGRDASRDRAGGVQGCAYDDCDGAGYEVDLVDAECADAFGSSIVEELSERDVILGIETVIDVDEAAQFVGLDLVGLAMLLAGRHIDPDEPLGGAPSTVECVGYLCRWPEVRVHGYALRPEREGAGAVRIEGFECDLDDVDPDRRAPLRESFRAYSDADVFRDDGERLFAWWS